MTTDADLQTLKEDSGFQLLCQGGRRQEVFEKVEAGQAFDLEIPSPLAFLAVGAYINGKPFEAWSFLVPPSQLEAELCVPETAEPGRTLAIKVKCSEASGVLLVVKDSRLQTGDTSTSKLAAQLKDCVERAKELFPPHQAPEDFRSLRTSLGYKGSNRGADPWLARLRFVATTSPAFQPTGLGKPTCHGGRPFLGARGSRVLREFIRR